MSVNVKALTDELQASEHRLACAALPRMPSKLLPAYEADDGPLTAGQLASVRKLADASLPKGQALDGQSLF